MARLTAEVWLQVETEFRAAVLGVDELAAKFGVHRNAISRRAKKEGWERVPGELKRQLVAAKLRAQTESVQVGVHAQLDADATHDAAVLNRAARTFDKILTKLEAATLATPDDAILALKALAEANDKAAAGYSKVRRLDDKPPEASDFEASVRKLREAGEL